MEEEADPYERQLLAVFKSCDTHGTGVLDENGFKELCDALQLEETHRSLLTTRLCFDNKCRVEFCQFRDALLAVLASLKSPTSDCDEQTSFYDNTNNADTPKLLFGGKKYGRRSRPSSTDQEEEKYGDPLTPVGEDTFESEIDSIMKSENEGKKTKNRSSNEYEIDSLCKHLGVHTSQIIGPPEIISICNSMGIINSVCDMLQEKINRIILETNSVDKTGLTYGQFFQLIKKLGYTTDSSNIVNPNPNLSKTAPFNDVGISSIDINSSGCISYDTLVYLFENAGISDAGIFLNDLGISPQFDVNLSELATQLQEELLNVQRCIDDSSNQLCTLLNPHLLLLQASVVVSQAQIKWYKLCMEQMQCERDKLRNDLLVANERASLLAQEVDDNHARMENSIQQKLKSLEQKHSDQIKKLAYQWSVEREQLTNQNLKMEKQLEQLLHDETKLRSEVASLKQDYENLEKENRNLLDQLLNAENMRDELESEIQRLSLLKKKVLELESSNEQAISFLEKMNQLQAENVMLRDKNDELVVELENVTLKHMQNRNGCSKRRGNLPLEVEENSDTDMATIATHRMFPKVRKYSTERDLSASIENTHSESISIGLMNHCESGVEADISTSSSSLDRIGETIAEANENVMIALKSKVVFLENFIKKYQLKVPINDGDVDFIDKTSERSADDLEKQCETLQQRLDQVQKEILKILSEKRACTEENCALKLKISDLMTRLPGSDLVANQANRVGGSNDIVFSSLLLSPSGDKTWSSSGSVGCDLSKQVIENRVLCDADALRFVENESRMAEPATPEKIGPEVNSVPTQTVDTSVCSSILSAVSEEESEMEWKTISDERKSNEDAEAEASASLDTVSITDNTGSEKQTQHYSQLLQNYNRLAKENKTLSDKCEELSSCLDMLRSEYDQCEEYWASKLDEERRLFEEEQRISDEKFTELKIKIDEYSEMLGAESMSLSKLPPIAENDKLEKEVNDLQEEFQLYKERMESENREKQNEINKLMQIISLYETSDSTVKHMNYEIERSLESAKSDKTYVLDNPVQELLEMPRVPETSTKLKTTKLNELKNRKKQLKRDCDKLEREKEALVEHLVKMMAESRMTYNFSPCSHAIQQHNAEVSKTGILLRLRHQEMKNRHLRNVLLQQQKKLKKTMQEMLNQHEKELAKYRSALTSSQEMWQSLQETTKKQAKQISESDELAKELYCENAQLRATIHQLEQQHLDCPSPVLL